MPKTQDATPTTAMADSLLTALTSQGHAVHGYVATVRGLVERGLAESLQSEQHPGFQLTAAGRLEAAELARKAQGTPTNSRLWAAAMAEARRVMRLGDDERAQPVRRVLVWAVGGGAAVDAGVKSADQVAQWAAKAILAGAEFRRLDLEGQRVKCVHLSGIVNEFVVLESDAAGADDAQAQGGSNAGAGRHSPDTQTATCGPQPRQEAASGTAAPESARLRDRVERAEARLAAADLLQAGYSGLVDRVGIVGRPCAGEITPEQARAEDRNER